MALQRAVARNDAPVPAWFDEMADAAIRRSVLVVAETRFAILEVEFYLHRGDHEDPYVHRSSAQRDSRGEWYFHREKAAKIGFTLKGLDITFGKAGRDSGGMLIRAVANAEGGGYVEGPSRTVDAVLRAAGVTSVADLKAIAAYHAGAFAPGGLVRIEARPAPTTDEIKVGPRIGLKGGDAFAAAPYRYRAQWYLTKKDRPALRAGRCLLAAPPVVATGPIATLLDADVEAILGFEL